MAQAQQTAEHDNAQAPAAVLAQRDEWTVEQLAGAVLARQVRPRAAELRRLAEAVLSRKSKKEKGSGKKAKNKKLARIPGQKKK